MLFPHASARGPLCFAPSFVDWGLYVSKMPPEKFPAGAYESSEESWVSRVPLQMPLEKSASCVRANYKRIGMKVPATACSRVLHRHRVLNTEVIPALAVPTMG